MKTLQKTSQAIIAVDPSEEFPWTWVDYDNGNMGMFFRTYEEAHEAAMDEYNDFSENMRGRQALIVKVKDKLQHRDQ